MSHRASYTDKYVAIFFDQQTDIVIYHGKRKAMKKEVILEIFAFLKNAAIVQTESEFSEDWLGHTECYMRTLRFKKADASLGTIAVCGTRMQKAGDQLIARLGCPSLGAQFIDLSEKCRTLVNAGDLTDILYHRHREAIASPPPDPEVVGQG